MSKTEFHYFCLKEKCQDIFFQHCVTFLLLFVLLLSVSRRLFCVRRQHNTDNIPVGIDGDILQFFLLFIFVRCILMFICSVVWFFVSIFMCFLCTRTCHNQNSRAWAFRMAMCSFCCLYLVTNWSSHFYHVERLASWSSNIFTNSKFRSA